MKNFAFVAALGACAVAAKIDPQGAAILALVVLVLFILADIVEEYFS